MTKTLDIPELSLVLLVGASGAGKSTFAQRHFRPTEVISSDYCRGLVADSETDQSATADAFAVLHFIAAKRLAAGRLTVIDATNVRPEDRKPLVELARSLHCLPVGIVFDLPASICRERNRDRPDRDFGPQLVARQAASLRRGLRSMKREGFSHVFILRSVEEVDAAVIERRKLYNDLRHETGPFDVIGDLHGCCDELEQLLAELGYGVVERREGLSLSAGPVFAHAAGRKAIFVGDLGDRGLRVLDCMRLVHNMVQRGSGLCVPGNHDVKLLRKLRGRDVQMTHGLATTWAEIEALPSDLRPGFESELAEFLDSLISHYVLDGGRLVVAHAGLPENMHGRGSPRVRDFALYGETTGETDEFGLPVRVDWASEYRGRAMVVYGHTPVHKAEWLNRTINIDTGCVFGGKLTALRYPERTLHSVAARRVYYESSRPFPPALAAPDGAVGGDLTAPHGLTAQQQHDDLLDIGDVIGKRAITTNLLGPVTIREENAAAALEVMSRFAVSPRWLIYLPPTMSPSETSAEPGLLEHPAQAFDYFARCGVETVVCEEKHMGSRAVVVVCRDEDAARRRFGVEGEGSGVCFTRTGRRFFNEPALERAFLARIRTAIDHVNWWQSRQSDWFCLDCELMPWSAKAQELIRSQYAAVGAAAGAALSAAGDVLTAARSRGVDTAALMDRSRRDAERVERFVAAYERYCWPVDGLTGLKLAPFHLLADESGVHADKDHHWHMDSLAELCRADPELLLATPYVSVDPADADARQRAFDWWIELTGRGGEGMVVKPLAFAARGKKGLIQPALKCRGREYLRIIYGPQYTADEHLSRLRERGLSGKRSLALREFALGIEGLQRFVRGEPLRRVHECVFGVLALESEPVDPRL